MISFGFFTMLLCQNSVCICHESKTSTCLDHTQLKYYGNKYRSMFMDYNII
jgi:hypothetical protein